MNLFAASRPKPVALRMLDEDGTPLACRWFCPKDGKYVESDQIVRGYEVGDDEELARLAPRKSRDIDLQRFVPRDGATAFQQAEAKRGAIRRQALGGDRGTDDGEKNLTERHDGLFVRELCSVGGGSRQAPGSFSARDPATESSVAVPLARSFEVHQHGGFLAGQPGG